MRRLSAILLAASLLATTPAFAQVEIGAKMGGTLAFGGGDSQFIVGVPGTGLLLAMPSVYVSFIAGQAFMIEPQVVFQYNAAGNKQASFAGALQLGYLLTPATSGSFYLAANGGWVNLQGDVKSGTLGGGAGYRLVVGTGAAVRVEALYRRWLCSGCNLNEVVLAVGAGGVF